MRKLIGGVQGLLRANGVKVIIGTAQFLDSKKLIVNVKNGEQMLTFDRIIIASGSVPAVPPIPGIVARNASTVRERWFGHHSRLFDHIGGASSVWRWQTLYSMLGEPCSIVERK